MAACDFLRESQMQNSGFSLKTVSAMGSKYHAVVTVFLACLCNQVPIAYSVYVRLVAGRALSIALNMALPAASGAYTQLFQPLLHQSSLPAQLRLSRAFDYQELRN
jgi:hypothetical protein